MSSAQVDASIHARSKQYQHLLNQVFQTTDDYKNGLRALFVEAAHVCLVLMHRAVNQGSFPIQNYENRQNFDQIRCYTTRFRYIPPPGDRSRSLETIGLLIYPPDPDDTQQKDLGRFSMGVPYVCDGLAIRILRNQFSPSPELQQGFDYRHQAIVIRGHEKHVAGEVSALSELRKDFETILSNVASDQENIEEKTQPEFSQAIQAFTQINALLKKPRFTPSKLQQTLHQKLDQLFKQADDIAYLRLYESNPQTNQQISKLQKKSKAFADQNLPQLVQGYFNRKITQEELSTLDANLKQAQEIIDKLKSVALTSDQVKKQDELKQAWNARIEEFHKIVSQNKITTAHGPIVRIYQDIDLSSERDVKIAVWHLLAQIIGIGDQTRPESYLPDPEYRQALLSLLNAEYTFYEKLPGNSSPIMLPRARSHLDSLARTHQFWQQFENLFHGDFYLQSTGQVKAELSKTFDESLGRVGNLKGHLLNVGSPMFCQNLVDRLDQVIVLLIQRIRLIDQKLKLGKQTVVDTNRQHYRDSYYAEKRRILDTHLFITLMSYLQKNENAQISNIRSKLMEEVAELITAYLIKERTYGPIEKKASFNLPSKELSQFLSQPIHSLEQVIKYQRSCNPDLTSRLTTQSESLEKSADRLDQKANEILTHLKTSNKNDDWWTVFYRLTRQEQAIVNEITNTTQEIQTHLQSIPPSVNFEATFSEKKEDLLGSLKRLRSLESKRSNLAKEINPLIQIIEQPQAPSRVNKGLIQAKNSVAALRKNLQELKKRTTPYDRFLRDRSLEKLGEVEAALVPDPMNEIFVRIQGISETMSTKYQTTPNLEQELQQAIDAAGLSIARLNQDQDQCLQGLFENVRRLNEETKKLWKTFELKYAIDLIDSIVQTLSNHYSIQWKDTFIDQTKALNLSLIKREWMSDRRTVMSSYMWNKQGPKQDPYFTANETHIRI